MSTMPSSQPLRVHCPKLEAQRADGFVANSDATFSEKIFNISVAEAGVILEPDCMAYDRQRESIALVGIHVKNCSQQPN
jgi:hypothetical protein